MYQRINQIVLILSLFCLGLWQCQTELQYKKGSVEHIKAVTEKIDD